MKMNESFEDVFETRRRFFLEMRATAVEVWSPEKKIWMHIRWEQGNTTTSGETK